MATNHTTNYQLNLWEPQDRFLRTEFNENSEKLDAALKAESDARAALAKKVDTKADASTVTALTQTVNGKADASTVTALSQALDAHKTQTAQALAGKADKTALTALTQQVTVLTQQQLLLDATLASDVNLYAIPMKAEYLQKYRTLLLYMDLTVSNIRDAFINLRTKSGTSSTLFRFYPKRTGTSSSGAFTDQKTFIRLELDLTCPRVFASICSQYRYFLEGRDSSSSSSNIASTGDYDLSWDQIAQLELVPDSNYLFLAGGRVQMYGVR